MRHVCYPKVCVTARDIYITTVKTVRQETVLSAVAVSPEERRAAGIFDRERQSEASTGTGGPDTLKHGRPAGATRNSHAPPTRLLTHPPV